MTGRDNRVREFPRPAPVAPAIPTVPVVHASGTRSCKVCKADVRVRVRAHRITRAKGGIAFAGYCDRCGTLIGTVGRSKIREADQVRLELVADEFNPAQEDLFAGQAAPAEQRRGDGA